MTLILTQACQHLPLYNLLFHQMELCLLHRRRCNPALFIISQFVLWALSQTFSLINLVTLYLLSLVRIIHCLQTIPFPTWCLHHLVFLLQLVCIKTYHHHRIQLHLWHRHLLDLLQQLLSYLNQEM